MLTLFYFFIFNMPSFKFSIPMKRTSMLLIFSLLGLSVQAQWSGGIKAGGNLIYSSWYVQSSSDTYTNASVHGGGYLNYRLTNAWSLQTEVLYNGLEIEFAGQELETTYLSIPLVLMFDFFENRITLHAGSQLSTLLSVEPNTLRENISDTEFSIVMGAGWNIQKFSITLRYGIGITNLASETLLEDFPDARVKNNILQLSVGYQLAGKSRQRISE